MTKTQWFSRKPNAYPKCTLTQSVAAGCAVAILTLMAGIASAQTPTPATATVPAAPHQNVEGGFVIHQTADLGGHIVGVVGSGAMYDTLVNLHSGPRVLGETYSLHAIPGSKHTFLDSLTAFSDGFGGDPYNFAKMDFSKGKTYEFSGTFHRDRQYFDYDLFGNPNIPGGQSIPIGAGGALGKYAWPQVNQSPELFNTVRRMTDTNLILFPLSKVTFRLGYAQNSFQGPRTLSGAYESVATSMLFREMQRNSTDNFLGAVDWKPLQHTMITFEEEVTHYKSDSTFTLAPNQYNVQEADGTRVALGNWDTVTPYSASNCNTNSIGTAGVVLTAASGSVGLPVVDPACDVISKYTRSQPTRVIYPTELVRFQSSSIRNLVLNGTFRYTEAKSNMPNYQENFQGLDGAIRSMSFTGFGTAKRQNVGADFGATWQISKKFSFSDQFDYSSVHIPGTGTFAGVTESTPSTAHNETVNYAGTLIAGTTQLVGQAARGVALPNYFGSRDLTNNATVTWDPASSTTVSFTYRYRTRNLADTDTATTPIYKVPITENGGILNVAFRPTAHWDINGTGEVLYDDNAFTSVGARQTRHYKVHTLYRPKPWATVSGAYNDLERHNNTNNTSHAIDGITPGNDGPLQHVDYSRVGSIGLVLAPSEHYGLDVNYSYSDIYTSTNICYDAAASPTLPGAATASGVGCKDITVRGTTYLATLAKDFADAPTQYASAGLLLSPIKSLKSTIGYTISSVSGNQFFNDARQVNGSLQSAYQSPYVHVAWTVHPGWVWKADYNFYSYGEGGPSGAPLCSATNPTATTNAPGIPCNSPVFAAYPTGLTEPSSGLTAPRNFHANVVTLSMHYEF